MSYEQFPIEDEASALELSSSDSRIAVGQYFTLDKSRSFTFKYAGEISETKTLRGVNNEFAGIKGTYAQTLGTSGSTFEMDLIFDGPTHDLDSAVAWKILSANEHGILHHPVYGVHRVAQLGELKRATDTTEDVHYTSISVTFTETLPDMYPQVADGTESEVLDLFNEFVDETKASFVAAYEVGDIDDQLSTIEQLEGVFRNIKNSINSLTDGVKSLEGDIMRASILNGAIDALVLAPANLATSLYQLSSAPIRSLRNMEMRLKIGADAMLYCISSYSDMMESYYGSDSKSMTLATVRALANEAASKLASVSFALASLFTGSAVHRYQDRQSALQGAAELRSVYDNAVAWRNALASDFPDVVQLFDWDKLDRLVKSSLALAVDQSNASQKKLDIITEQASDLIVQVWELLAKTDEAFDDFIVANNLSASEMLTIPPGRVLTV